VVAWVAVETRGGMYATMNEPAMVKLLHVVGTRPNFMKAAAIIRAAERWNERGCTPQFVQILVHTGQHYDDKMCRVFFDDLGLPRPDYDLEIGSGTHAEQTARVMLALEPVVVKEAPDLVMTVGDVNSTVAAALVAAKLNIPVAHVEAGLRSGDRGMPEELNRLVTDQLCDLLFTTSRDADQHLAAEGIPNERVHFVGNTMIDSLEAHLPRALATTAGADLGLITGGYAVVTLHRPSNVDDETGLELLVQMLMEVGKRLPVVFPVHARTRKQLTQFGLFSRLDDSENARPAVILCEPLGYLDFLGLMAKARLVLTDSGGIQEETTVLGIPCLTLRKNTERPVTITEGTNKLVDPQDLGAIIAAVDEVLAAEQAVGAAIRRPEYWDGGAGERIVTAIALWSHSERPSEPRARVPR
jgi:UDP-N-acetylglucosamine 2-epimerase (non-hydrolysing)